MKKYPAIVKGKRTKLYVAWSNMAQRCNNPNNPQYKHYGGRGITICEEWKSYDNFHEWAMSNGYTDSLTLDRIDVNGNYSPDNCRWVSMKVQGRNRRNNVKLEGKCLSEIAEENNLTDSLVRSRYSCGNTDIEDLTKPVRSHIDICGRSIKELAMEQKIPEKLIRNRYRKGIRDANKLCDQINKNKASCDILLIGGKTFRELSVESGIPIGVLRNRYYMQKKLSVEELTAPYRPRAKRTAL